MNKTALVAAVVAGLAGIIPATATTVFNDDFESYSTGQSGTITNVWTTTGNEWIGGSDGVGESQGQRLRHGSATISKLFDITSDVAGANTIIKLAFDGWVDGYEAGEQGWIQYTTDSGATWNTTLTLADLSTYADYDLPGYTGPYTAFEVDTTGWSPTQKASFGIRFGQDCNANTERFYIDNVILSSEAGAASGNAPATTNDNYAVDEDGTLNIVAPGVLANDSDPDGDPISAHVASNPSHGGLTLNTNGSFTYTPDPDFFGNDSFTYQASDGTLLSTAAVANITVNPLPDSPTAADYNHSTTSNKTLTVSAPGLLGTGFDVDGDVLTASPSPVQNATNGSLTINTNGSFLYTPNVGFTGSDSFLYELSDGTSASTGTVSISVVQVVSSTKPNILLFFADDMGWSDCQYYQPSSLVDMPHVEQLATNGMAFSKAYSAASLCQPSRYSVLTGNYPFRGGGNWNFNGGANVYAGQLALGTMLQQQGYRTAMLGKGHLGGLVPKKGGGTLTQNGWAKHMYKDMDLSLPLINSMGYLGFDYSLALPGGIQDAPYAYFENDMLVTALSNTTGNLQFAPFNTPPTWLETLTETYYSGTPDEMDVEFVVWDNVTHANANGDAKFKGQNFHTSLASRNANDPTINGAGFGMPYWESNQVGIHITQKAVEFIDNVYQTNLVHGSDTPFFMHFCAEAVHEPQTPPIDFLGTPVKGVTGGSNHMDMLRQLDLQIGTLLNALETRGMLDNTIVIVTSDNGGRSDSVSYGHNSNEGHTGKKSTYWEGGLRVPFIVRWGDGTPGGSIVAPGTWNHEMVNITDIYATIAELHELTLDDQQGMDSVSILPLLLGSTAPVRDKMFLQDSGGHVVRFNDMKLILEKSTLTPKGLYDLAADIREIPDINNAIELKGSGVVPLGVSGSDTPNNLKDDPSYAQLIADMTTYYTNHWDMNLAVRTTPEIDFDPDYDDDGIPNDWEIQYGLNTTNSADAVADTDNDGFTSWEEYMAGTDPTNKASLFWLTTEPGVSTGNIFAVEWFSAPNRIYQMQQSTNLIDWMPLENSIPATPPSNHKDILVSTNEPNMFFRINVELE
jgi:arylsulfatase A-like enzyme